MKSRRFGLAESLIALLLLGIVVVLVLIVLARTYPTAAQEVGLQLTAGGPWVSDLADETVPMSENVLQRASEGWEYRFAGPFRRLVGGVQPAIEETAGVNAAFPVEECEGCHPGFQDKARFSVVYAPHDLHLAGGIPCERCHASSGPNRDRVPPMSGCAECHLQTRVIDGCPTCHPPGDLFHGAALAGDREIGERCETCHSEERLVQGARVRGVTSFDSSADSCAACHETSYCDRCHPATHPAGYGARHDTDFRRNTVTHRECYECHVSGWCALRCHTR